MDPELMEAMAQTPERNAGIPNLVIPLLLTGEKVESTYRRRFLLKTTTGLHSFIISWVFVSDVYEAIQALDGGKLGQVVGSAGSVESLMRIIRKL